MPSLRPLQRFSGVDGAIYHWVGIPFIEPTLSEVSVKAMLRGLQRDAFSEGYSDIEYNFAVDAVGRIYELRGWDWRSGANGSLNYNAHAYAFVYLAGRTADRSKVTPLTDPAKAALLWLAQEAARRHSAFSYARPHSAVRATECPGAELKAYIPHISKNLRPEPAPVPVPPPSTEEEPVVIPSPYPSIVPGRIAYALFDRARNLFTLHNGADCEGSKEVFGVRFYQPTSNYPLTGGANIPGTDEWFVTALDSGTFKTRWLPSR